MAAQHQTPPLQALRLVLEVALRLQLGGGLQTHTAAVPYAGLAEQQLLAGLPLAHARAQLAALLQAQAQARLNLVAQFAPAQSRTRRFQHACRQRLGCCPCW